MPIANITKASEEGGNRQHRNANIKRTRAPARHLGNVRPSKKWRWRMDRLARPHTRSPLDCRRSEAPRQSAWPSTNSVSGSPSGVPSSPSVRPVKREPFVEAAELVAGQEVHAIVAVDACGGGLFVPGLASCAWIPSRLATEKKRLQAGHRSSQLGQSELPPIPQRRSRTQRKRANRPPPHYGMRLNL